MKIQPECIPCLLRRVIFEAELVAPEKALKAVTDACAILSRADPNTVSVRIATEVHRHTYALLENADPYKKLKEKSTQVALGLLPRAKALIKNAENPLETALLMSIAGNVLDFGIRKDLNDPTALAKVFDTIVKEGLYVNELNSALSTLDKGAEVLYFTDNCGEVVFDALLIEQLKALGLKITAVVKDAPILTDATPQDIQTIEFSPHHVLTTGSNAVGIDFESIGDELKERLETAPLIISKGMANFEAFSETTYTPILYVMRTKCRPVAEALSVPVDVNVAKLVRPSS